MIGTIITDVRIYTAAGSLVMQAQVGDKVEGQGTTITRLTRNGVQKLAGTYYVGQTGCVAWDTVTPPPDPTPDTIYPVEIELRPRLSDGTLGEAKIYRKVEQ